MLMQQGGHGKGVQLIKPTKNCISMHTLRSKCQQAASPTLRTSLLL